MNGWIPDPIDAVAPNPKTGTVVWLGNRRLDRGPFETAWLVLAEHSGDRMAASKAMLNDGWSVEVSIDYVAAAQFWTGNVVQGAAR